jgi:hypothetical protein
MAIIRTGNVVDVTIPTWLYELLPLFYITGGVLAASKLGGVLVDLSSALLIVAGIQILRMRADYRESMRYPNRSRIRSRS